MSAMVWLSPMIQLRHAEQAFVNDVALVWALVFTVYADELVEDIGLAHEAGQVSA